MPNRLPEMEDSIGFTVPAGDMACIANDVFIKLFKKAVAALGRAPAREKGVSG